MTYDQGDYKGGLQNYGHVEPSTKIYEAKKSEYIYARHVEPDPRPIYRGQWPWYFPKEK
jgi:hypothetical protein